MSAGVRRLIEAPGYHVRPKYDLAYFRQRRHDKGHKNVDFNLNMTPLIDMFSTLVIFLLLNFSATGEAYFVSKSVTIPGAVHARPLESAPIVSITKDSVVLDAAVVGNNPMNLTESDWEMPQLVAGLRKIRELQDNMRAAGIKEKSEINIQADQDTPVVKIKRVMNILIQEGFSGVNFAVREVNPEDL